MSFKIFTCELQGYTKRKVRCKNTHFFKTQTNIKDNNQMVKKSFFLY